MPFSFCRSLRALPFAALAAFAAAACSGRSNDGPITEAHTRTANTATITEELTARGLDVAGGSFEFLDMSACCATSCAGNNPSSPYGAFFVPRGPGQSAANPGERSDGTSFHFRMRRDEAILFVGPTPPEVRYFGFTPYLDTRVRTAGGRDRVAASVSETLNDLVIGVDAPPGTPVFARQTAVLAAADANTVAAARQALVAAGVPDSAINVLVFDPAVVHFGLEENADTVAVLFRMALPSDPAAFERYRSNPGGSLFRLTPSAPGPANPLPSPTARPKNTSHTELALSSAVDELQRAVIAAYPDYAAQAIDVDDGVSDPEGCIAGTSECAYDNRDTTYPQTRPRVLFQSDDDFYVVYGVDHQAFGKVAYANVSVYAVEHLVGIDSVASDRYPGSAQAYLPGSGEAARLYAWKIARRCNGEAHCLEVAEGSCPTGIDNGKLGVLAFRTYLEPGTKTAPDPSTLIRDRVLRFRRR